MHYPLWGGCSSDVFQDGIDSFEKLIFKVDRLNVKDSIYVHKKASENVDNQESDGVNQISYFNNSEIRLHNYDIHHQSFVGKEYIARFDDTYMYAVKDKDNNFIYSTKKKVVKSDANFSEIDQDEVSKKIEKYHYEKQCLNDAVKILSDDCLKCSEYTIRKRLKDEKENYSFPYVIYLKAENEVSTYNINLNLDKKYRIGYFSVDDEKKDQSYKANRSYDVTYGLPRDISKPTLEERIFDSFITSFIDPKIEKITIGEEIKLSYSSFSPVTGCNFDDFYFTYTSDPSVVDIDSSGKATALKEGVVSLCYGTIFDPEMIKFEDVKVY